MISEHEFFWIITLSFVIIVTMVGLYGCARKPQDCGHGIRVFLVIELIVFFSMLLFAKKLP